MGNGVFGCEFFGGIAPDSGEGYSGYDQAGAKAEPKAYCSPVKSEAEEVADGETDDPVANDLDVEAGVSVAGAAECSGGGDLEAVEELEDGGDEEKRDGGGDDGGVGGEGAGDGVWREEHNGGEAGHGSGAKGNGGP